MIKSDIVLAPIQPDKNTSDETARMIEILFEYGQPRVVPFFYKTNDDTDQKQRFLPFPQNGHCTFMDYSSSSNISYILAYNKGLLLVE